MNKQIHSAALRHMVSAAGLRDPFSLYTDPVFQPSLLDLDLGLKIPHFVQVDPGPSEHRGTDPDPAN